MPGKKYISTVEAAKILGISREAVFKRIQSGALAAIKVGRNFAIDPNDLGHSTQEPSTAKKKALTQAVRRAFREYGNALKKLGDA